jgi:hypothetical protein
VLSLTLPEQAEADLAQIAALLLIMPAPRKFGRGAGIDVGEEISAVVDQGAEIQLKPLDEALGDLFLAFEDMFGGTRPDRLSASLAEAVEHVQELVRPEPEAAPLAA